MHTPVLLQETLDGLELSADMNCIDATVGFGGHAREMLSRTSPNGKLAGFDRDGATLLLATQELKEFKDRFIAIHDSYANIDIHRQRIEAMGPIHGILMDLGLSSIQLDDPERGFAFRFNGPLDMRFDQTSGPTASEVLNTASEGKLADIFYHYGEVRGARKLARAVVASRKEKPFHTTDDLTQLVEKELHFDRNRRTHPATRVFQALRIEVNHELAQLKKFLPYAVNLLVPGGRLAIITFHSIEDRIVKNTFRLMEKDCVCPPEIPECRCNHESTVSRVTRKPIIPSESEIAENPRARSAKLRIVQKK